MAIWTKRSLCALTLLTGILVAWPSFAADTRLRRRQPMPPRPPLRQRPNCPRTFPARTPTRTSPRGPIPPAAPPAFGPRPPATARATSPPSRPSPTSTTASPTTCSRSTWSGRLIAGFLVMFMQAGFAMVETGLCRAKNAAHTMSMNLMIYALGCIGFWAYGFAIGWGNWINGPVAPGWYSSLGPGTSVLNSGWGLGASPMRRRRRVQVRPDRTEGLLPQRRGRRERHGPVLLHDGVHGHHGHDSHRRHGRTLELEELLPLRTLGGAALLHLRQLGLGRRLAGPNGRELETRPRGGRFRRLRRRPCHGRHHRPGRRHGPRPATGKISPKTASRCRSPAITCRWSSWARSSWPSAGSASTPARPWPAPTCGSARSWSTRCWPASPARLPRC